MDAQNLTAFEKRVIAGLAYKAGLAAALLATWASLPADSVQSIRSLVDGAQLGVTEEGGTRELLERATALGLLESAPAGYRPRAEAQSCFQRLAFTLGAIDYYVRAVHRDATNAQVVLTKPPGASALEQKLAAVGWRTADLERTDQAFNGMVRSAERRVIVMTPFFDPRGAAWLQELLSHVPPNVDRLLILRSLEDRTRQDYPTGFDAIAPWLSSAGVRVFNYSIPHADGTGRETFHAKVVLCDRSTAYVGSSNVTAASLGHSMEMGVVLQGRAAADVAEVIDAVLEAATKVPTA